MAVQKDGVVDKQAFFRSYRVALYEGFLDEKNAPKIELSLLKKVKQELDKAEKEFVNGKISEEGLISSTNERLGLSNPETKPLWNPGRDICIGLHIAVGAAVLAAWVASGGTLSIGAVAAGGVVITETILAALVGGASAATIACILGSCGDC